MHTCAIYAPFSLTNHQQNLHRRFRAPVKNVRRRRRSGATFRNAYSERKPGAAGVHRVTDRQNHDPDDPYASHFTEAYQLADEYLASIHYREVLWAFCPDLTGKVVLPWDGGTH